MEIMALIIFIITGLSIDSNLRKTVKQNERIIELLEKSNLK